ncbi:MAG: head-tail connector protein [Marinobacterium sp.]
MIVTLEEAKQYLRVDHSDDDALITLLIGAAEQFLQDATGKTFDASNSLAKVVCLTIIADLYDQRQVEVDKVGVRTRRIIELALTQLSMTGE